MYVYKPHTGPVRSLAFSPDGDFLASSSSVDATLKIQDLKQRRRHCVLAGSKFCCPIAFSPDGALLARGGTSLAVWEWSAPRPRLVLTANGIIVEALSFSHDGTVLASQATHHALKRWSIPARASLPAAWGGGRTETRFPIGCLAHAAHAALLASAFGAIGDGRVDSVLMLWDACSGEPRGELRTPFTFGHPSAIALAPDGHFLAGLYGPSLVLFDLHAQTLLHEIRPSGKQFKGLAFSPDGRKLATVNADLHVQVWSLPALKEKRIFKRNFGKLIALASTRDGSRLAAGNDSGQVMILDVDW